MSNAHPAPAEIGWLVRIVGEDNALRLVEEHGGSRLHVPQGIERSRLPDQIGIDAARALCAEHAGTALRIPACKHWRVRVYRARGMSVSAIAKRLGWDETTVYRAIKGRVAEPRHHQIDFDF